jgi:probable HAF family extracellular repeat protein
VPLPPQAFGSALNDNGHMTGDLPQGGGGNHAFFWDGTTLQDIHALGNKSVPTKINDADEIVGWFQTSAIPQKAFRWKSGIMTDLGTFGGPESTAFGINQVGQVVGSAETPNLNDRAFIWTDLDGDSISDSGEMVQLPDMGLSSAANGVNDAGAATGFVLNSLFRRRGAIWFNNSGFVQTGVLPNSTESEAFDINNHGQVVGRSGEPFLWDNGQIVALSTLVPQIQGWTLTTAIGINDDGWIVGEGLRNGAPMGYVLRPIPEPVGVCLLIAGIALQSFAWRQKRR